MADYLGRTGGPYLDQVELEDRERRSAEIEGREPDFSAVNLRIMANLPPLEPVSDSSPETAVEEKAKGIKLSEAPVSKEKK